MTEIRCPFGETRACATEAVEERCKLRELNGDLVRLLDTAKRQREEIRGLLQETVGAVLIHVGDLTAILGADLEREVHRVTEAEAP